MKIDFGKHAGTLKCDNPTKLMELIGLCEERPCFIYDGLLIAGAKVFIVKKYLQENPSKKFRTWLRDSKHFIQQI